MKEGDAGNEDLRENCNTLVVDFENANKTDSEEER